MDIDKHMLVNILSEMGKDAISINTKSTPNKEIIFPKKGIEKIIFNHSLFGIPIGVSNIHLINENSNNLTFEQKSPEKHIFYVNFDPLKYVSGLTRNGGKKFSSKKINNYKLEILMNAQIIKELYSSSEYLKDLKIIGNSTSANDKPFFDAIGVKSKELIFKGITLTKMYKHSIFSARKAGFWI